MIRYGDDTTEPRANQEGVHMDKLKMRSLLANALFDQADKSKVDGICIHDTADGACAVRYVPVEKEAENG